jgi:pimeloyl-ACP methyl ester carboxylesterase
VDHAVTFLGEVMTGVGHVPNWTHPEAFAALIEEIISGR